MGVSKGNWNGYGGRIELGEEVLEAAIRELQEEAGVVGQSNDLRYGGVMTFFRPGDEKAFKREMEMHIYTLEVWVGELKETEAMGPVRWFGKDLLPYSEMLPGTELWLPYVLGGEEIKGFLYYKDGGVGEYEIERVSGR